jgi:uncharacterized protein YPO0396
VLGADNARKIDLLEQRREHLQEIAAELNSEISVLVAERDVENQRISVLGVVAGRRWVTLDREGAKARVRAAESDIEELQRGNADLEAARKREQEAGAASEDAKNAHITAASEALSAKANLAKSRALLSRLEGEIDDDDGDSTVPDFGSADWDEAAAELAPRYRAVRRKLSVDTVEEVWGKVAGALAAERRRADGERLAAQGEFERAARAFLAEHPALGADLTDAIDDHAGYMDLLQEIEGTGLPQHEERFAMLLREQSQQLTGYLLAELRDAPAAIKARIAPINRSLGRSPFDTDRFLSIRVGDQRGEEVRRFMRELEEVSAGSWAPEELPDAERRFGILKAIMARLSSSQAADQAWKARCLDTREHVTFSGIEKDRAGRLTNIYDSATSLSGGQREKLVIFCLAAALRYQLTDGDEGVPSYGTVILDEAFGKTDTVYARIIMDVLVEFGFHLVLSTPLKLLQTIEDYVGAVTYVENRDRNSSRTSTAAMEDAGR